MLIWYFFVTGMDSLRAVIGPLPNFICFSNIFLKNLLCCNMLLTVLAITSTRFMFVCIYKSIPSMDDDFFANLLYRSINLISLLLVSIRVKSPGKYPLNYVRLISSPKLIPSLSFFWKVTSYLNSFGKKYLDG